MCNLFFQTADLFNGSPTQRSKIGSPSYFFTLALPTLLRPLLPEHLGILAIGCLGADGPARAGAIQLLLRSHFGFHVSEDVVSEVLARVLTRWPQLVAGYAAHESVLQPCSPVYSALYFPHYVPAHWPGRCIIDGGLLLRHATYPTTCFSLTLGMTRGEIVLLRCRECGAIYAGSWCWPVGGDAKTFPEGHHVPKGATSLKLLDDSRWFFATPQVCWETSFLRLCLLLAARAGTSWTALFTVYFSLFGDSMSGTQYATREHFILSLEVAVMTWASMRLICEAKVDSIWSVSFFLRPHNLAADFEPLLCTTRRAFEALSSAHARQCPLFRKVPAIVVDGKWCMQVSLCNDREAGCLWEPALATGCLTGCTARPLRGSKYCAEHQLTTDEWQADVAADSVVEGHVEVKSADGVHMEYIMAGGARKTSAEIPVRSIREYELERLPKQIGGAADPCSKDPRRGTSETYINRKSGGMLVAVCPCMHIIGSTPLYSTESLTQVLLFVWHVTTYVTGLVWVLYDYACGMVRHLRAQAPQKEGTSAHQAWLIMQALRWVVDRLHFCKGHKACKCETSKYYEPSVNPYVSPPVKYFDAGET